MSYQKILLLFLAFCIAKSNIVLAQGFVDEKLTSASQIATAVANIGFIGNAFRGNYSRDFPSCEFPRGSGIEHVFQGGLWVGGFVNGQPRVSTAAFNSSRGYSTGQSGFEFTAPVGSRIVERSTRFNSPFYRSDAVSHQDMVFDFTDKNVLIPGSTNILISGHVPLGLDVHCEVYNWDENSSNFFVFFNYQIINTGTNRIDSVHVGFWSDGVVRNVNRTLPGGTPFFNKGGNYVIDSLYTAYEWDSTGDVGFTPTYFATAFMGASHKGNFLYPTNNPNFKFNFNAWDFNNNAVGFFTTPSSDADRFTRMAQSLYNNPSWENIITPQLRTPSNRSNLIAVGPYGSMMPGDTVEFVMAIICASKKDDGVPTNTDSRIQRENLIKNIQQAQKTYFGEDKNKNGILDAGEDLNKDGKLTRFVVPEAPAVPRIKVVPASNSVDVYWSNASEFSIDPISGERDFEGYKVYRSRFGFDQNSATVGNLDLVAAFDIPNGIFVDNGFDKIKLPQPVQFEGDTTTYHYKFTMNNLQSGWQHAIAVTAFDRGDPVNQIDSLESSKNANLTRAFTGTKPNADIKNNEPFVYPNPYYLDAAWEGNSTRQEDKKIMFANLPQRAIIRIFTTSGDFIQELKHNAATYKGENILWYKTYSNLEQNVLSGGEHAWNLLSANNQIIARGMYLFTVEDLDSGKTYTGKFTVIR